MADPVMQNFGGGEQYDDVYEGAANVAYSPLMLAMLRTALRKSSVLTELRKAVLAQNITAF